MKVKFLNLFMICMTIPSLLLAKYYAPEEQELLETEKDMTIIKIGDFINEISEGIPLDKLKNAILECPAGTRLPFRFTLRGDVLGFEPYNPLEISLKFLKPVYILHRRNHLLFSTDMKRWLPGDQFFSGKAGGSLSFENQMAIANFDLELNHQKNRWEAAHCANWRLRWRTTEEKEEKLYRFQTRSNSIPLVIGEQEPVNELNRPRIR